MKANEKLGQLLRLMCLAMLLILAPWVSEAQFTVGVQVRPRAEFRNGFKTLTTEHRDPAAFVEQRSRLYANYLSEKFEVKINFQDVRIWGSTNQVYKNETGTLTNIYEAWGRYRFNPNVSMKIGRMDLNYANARFFGNLDWAAQGRSHDAVVFTYQTDSSDFKIDVGGAFNQTGLEPAKLSDSYYVTLDNYKTMQFVWAQQRLGSSLISLLIQNDGRQVATDSSMAYRQTYGVMSQGKLSEIGYSVEAYYQGGKNGTGTAVNAFALSASVTVPTKVTPLTVGIDYLSGTKATDSKDKSFNPLYGTNHKFYGFMDYFYVGNAHAQQGKIVGLVDLYLKTKFKIGEHGSLQGHAHWFNSAADLFDPDDLTTKVSKYLGTEVDLVYSYTLDKDVSLSVGYSQMFASESMEFVKATEGDHTAFNNWAWVMINFNPKALIETIRK